MPCPPVLALLLSLLTSLALAQRPAEAASITVTTATDELNADGDCSLREAVRAANTNLAVDACPAGQNDQTDTITLPAGTYTLTLTGDENDAANGDLDIRDNAVVNASAADLVITGAGAATTIVQACAVEQLAADCPAGQGVADRVFHVVDASAAISGLTVRHGRSVPLNNTRRGLGIYMQRFTGLVQPALALTDVVVTRNGATDDPSVAGEGGGISNDDGTLTLTRVRVTDNALASGWGGGLHNRKLSNGTPVLVMTDSTVSDNTVASGGGGGIYNVQNVTATLTGCTISGNEAAGNGGGIFNLNDSTMTLTNCTVSGNRAFGSHGGGIVLGGGTVELRSSTVTLNRLGTGQGAAGITNTGGGTVVLRNSIVAGNIHDLTPASGFYSPDCDDNGSSPVESEGYNVIGNGNQCPQLIDGANGDQVGTTGAEVDALLAPLADNGGLTLTHALLGDSPALDAANPATPGSGGTACPTTDQRGEARPNGAACDVGALEGEGGVEPGEIDVDAVKPARGGDAGTVQMQVYGTGFVDGATVRLVRAGFAAVVGSFTSRSGRVLSTSFDLRGVAAGTWSVVVENPDTSSATLANAFTVEAGGTAELWSSLVLPRSFIAGRTQSIYVVFGNRGTIDAYGVPLWLSFPEELEYHVPFPIEPPPSQAGSVTTDWTRIAIDVPAPPPEDRDSFPMLLPVVPAGSTGALRFRVKSPLGADASRLPFHVIADVGLPYFRPDLAAHVVALHLERAKELATPNDASVVLPSDAAIEAYIRTQLAAVVAAGRAGAVAGGYPPVYSQTQLLVDTAQYIATASTTAFGPAIVRRWFAALTRSLEVSSAAAVIIDPDCDPTDIFCERRREGRPPIPCPFPKFLRACEPPPPPRCDTFQFVDEEYVFVPCKPKNDEARDITTSNDPNDKVGPGGDDGFVDGVAPLPYVVMFENLPTASGDAFEVTITDQLDVAKYDLDTFSLGPISFGATYVPVPPGLSSYTTEVDLRPARNILVGVDAALDKATGIVTWKLTTLDPATGEFPEDPEQGFLPPNATSPDGEGSALFTVSLKPGFPVGTTVCNDARIVFDFNAPIDTPEFCNVIGTPPIDPEPEGPEINCGNCADDDADGLTDFEDPDCCAGGPTVSLQRAQMKPAKTLSRVLLKGALGGTLPDVTTTGLTLQVRPTGGDALLCARIPPNALRRKGKAVRFVDKKGKVSGAGGLANVVLKSKKDGSAALTIAAKKAAFATPPAGPLTITFGFGDGTTPGHCTAITPTFRAKKKGAIVAP